MSVGVLAAIEFGQLGRVVWISLAAGVVVISAFALVVLESGRSGDARRNGRPRAAAVHATLAGIFLAAFAAIVVVGIVIMLKKP